MKRIKITGNNYDVKLIIQPKNVLTWTTIIKHFFKRLIHFPPSARNQCLYNGDKLSSPPMRYKGYSPAYHNDYMASVLFSFLHTSYTFPLPLNASFSCLYNYTPFLPACQEMLKRFPGSSFFSSGSHASILTLAIST